MEINILIPRLISLFLILLQIFPLRWINWHIYLCDGLYYYYARSDMSRFMQNLVFLWLHGLHQIQVNQQGITITFSYPCFLLRTGHKFRGSFVFCYVFLFYFLFCCNQFLVLILILFSNISSECQIGLGVSCCNLGIQFAILGIKFNLLELFK